MNLPPKQISFQNSQNPKAAFDLIRLEDVQRRKDMDHSPFKLHLVQFYLVILIEAGAGYHTIDFKDYPVRRGTLLTIRKDQIHRFHQSDSLRGKMLLFTDEFLVSYLESLEVMKTFQLFNDVLSAPVIQPQAVQFEEIDRLTERISAEYFDLNDVHSLGIIRSELHILLTKLFRIKAGHNHRISDRKYLEEFITLQRLIEQHAFERKKVMDYGSMMGLSTKTLNTITQSIIHKSAKAFIDEVSTKHIKRLLINTEDSVKEVAFASGFEETTNFYKYFKRHTGVTPEQFRAKSK